MHIILVSNRLATARTFVLKWWHLAAAFVLTCILLTGMSSLVSYIGLRHAVEQRLPFLRSFVLAVNAEESERSQAYVQENINAMAVRLGQMQAQLMRLDAVGERLADMSGLKPQELKAIQEKSAGRGGPLISPSSLSVTELSQALDKLAQQVEAKSDAISLIEAQMLEAHLKKSMLPTGLPIAVPWNASTYGWRIDPITGERAMHEGVDFPAAAGEAISASAAGVVITAEYHPQYGNMVEIDHGNGLTTRYAHASKLLVETGMVVKRGQKIAEVGSTGRSTGAHLHFEVRLNGAAQSPVRFLEHVQSANKASAGKQKMAQAQKLRGKHYRIPVAKAARAEGA